MRHARTLLAIVLGIVIGAGAVFAQQQRDDAKLREAAQKRVAAAAMVLTDLDKREAEGEVLSPAFMQMKSTWRRNLLEASLAAYTDKESQHKALRAYLSDCERARDFLRDMMHGGGLRSLPAAEYDVADAEYRIAEHEAR